MAVTIKPMDAEAHNNLGQAYFKAGKYQEGLKDFKEAVRLKPDYSEAHFNLGVTYVALKDARGAREELAILKKLDPKLAEQLSRFDKK